MKFSMVYSSVVFAGNGFTPSIFNAAAFPEILGEPDPDNQLVTAIASSQTFLSSKFKVVILPDRIDFGCEGEDYLPETLRELSLSLLKKIKETDIFQCTGLGINMNVVISDKALGMTGLEYCRKNYLNIQKLEEKLKTSNFLANMVKLIYEISGIRYTIDIEPNFKTKGNYLHVKINAHQEIGNSDALGIALKKYDEIKSYLQTFHDNFLGE